MGSVYKFNRVYPPLMKDYSGDVLGVPGELLRETIGTTTWTTEKPDTVSMLRAKGQVIESQFDLTRIMYWTMFIPPEHFAEDITKTVTIISGVSEIDRHTMERDLEATASASGFGLSASVKASLKITDEMTHEWHRERREEREQTFKAGNTYCTWMLMDEMILRKTTGVKFGGKLVPMPGPYRNIIVTDSNYSCILATYQDKWQSESIEGAAEALKLQAMQEAPEMIEIALPTGKLTTIGK